MVTTLSKSRKTVGQKSGFAQDTKLPIRPSIAIVMRKPCTTALAVGGPYRFTRNPMYLGLVFITAGLALLANALWPLILLPVVIVILRRAVIDREERYLTAKFGEEYLQYKARVRRWL